MSKRRNNKTETLVDILARIEAERRDFNDRCAALKTASVERDKRVTALMGW